MKTLKKFQKIITELSTTLLERSEHIEAMAAAILSGENIFLLGKPGTAKSMLAREFFSRVTGASYFELLLTKTTTPEEIFGPVDLQQYIDNKNFCRNVEGKLPTAHYGFVDEIWKSSSAILNTLLTIINEKIFHNGTEILNVPLRSLVSASNEFPEGMELDALLDRFVIKLEVNSITETSNRLELLSGSKYYKKITRIKLSELDALVSQCQAVKLPKSILKRVLNIQDKLKDAGIRVSDRVLHRTCADCDRHGVPRANILKAKALLAGRNVVTEDDLVILEHAFWATIDERDKARQIIRKEANPLALKIDEILVKAKEYYFTGVRDEGTNEKSKMEIASECQSELKTLVDEIDGILDDSAKRKIHGRARTARGQIQEWHKEMVERFITI